MLNPALANPAPAIAPPIPLIAASAPVRPCIFANAALPIPLTNEPAILAATGLPPVIAAAATPAPNANAPNKNLVLPGFARIPAIILSFKDFGAFGVFATIFSASVGVGAGVGSFSTFC